MKTQNSPKSVLNKVDRPLVIVHCVRSTVGGIFRHISDLIKHQSACGHKVGLICDSLTGGEFEAEKVEALKPYMSFGVVQIPMSRGPSLSDAFVTKTVYNLLKQVDVDVIHCHGAKGGAFGRFAANWLTRERTKQGLPAVVAIYSPHGGSLHYSPISLQGQLYFKLERFMENFTSEFIFVAGFEVEAYSRKIGRLTKPWSIAYNGLEDKEFTPVKPAVEASDFVYAGHMRDLKGADLFIDAVEIASARSGVAITATMIGDGEDLPKYKQEVERRGMKNVIQFLPSMPIRDAFKRAKNLVVPSRAEALPYIVVEALGARVPVIATSVGGVPEIYDGYSHHLLPPGDANLIATAMLDRLARPEKASNLAGALRQQVRQKFSIANMFDKVDEVYLRNLSKQHFPGVDHKRWEAEPRFAKRVAAVK